MQFNFNPFLPITVEQLFYLSQANGTWILIYAVQFFTDRMLGILWSRKTARTLNIGRENANNREHFISLLRLD